MTFLPVLGPWIQILQGEWGPPASGTLIVLGSEETSGGVLGQSSYWRTVYAIYEWRGGKVQKIVLSGASVIEPMRDFLVAHGVPRESIVMEGRSRSTRENALYVTPMLRGLPSPHVLMSSDYHMRRAYRAFRKCGADVRPLPLPDAWKRAETRSLRWQVLVDLCKESAKTVWYTIHGWI